MFRIGEFSKLTQVSIRMLRYYDEIGLLKPAKIDNDTGYRMYAVEQIPILNKIVYLRDSGFQVAEIQTALDYTNDDLIIKQLEDKYKEILAHIQLEQKKLLKIEMAKNQLLGNKDEIHYQVLIKSIPSYHILSLRKVIPNYYAEGELWHDLSEFIKEQQIKVSDNTFSIYHDQEYKEENVDVELCVTVDKDGEDRDGFKFSYTQAVPMMACTMVYGDFSNIANAYLSFAKWLQENRQYKMTGENRQIVHRGPWNESDPQKYLTEIQIPIENIL